MPRNLCICWQEIRWVACLSVEEVERPNYKEVERREYPVTPFSSHYQTRMASAL